MAIAVSLVAAASAAMHPAPVREHPVAICSAAAGIAHPSTSLPAETGGMERGAAGGGRGGGKGGLGAGWGSGAVRAAETAALERGADLAFREVGVSAEAVAPVTARLRAASPPGKAGFSLATRPHMAAGGPAPAAG